MKLQFRRSVTSRRIEKIKTKTFITLSAVGLLVGSGGLSLALTTTAEALAPPAWSLNGAYTLDFELSGSHYVHDATIAGQNNAGNFTVGGGYPAGGTYSTAWNGTGHVHNSAVTLSVDYTLGAPSTHMNMVGTISATGTLSGTWSDNYQGTRSGTWTSVISSAKQVSQVVVTTPLNSQGWSTDDTRTGGAVSFATDTTAPGDPHDGALQLTTDGTTTSKAQYMHTTNIPLSNVSELSYATKQVSAAFAGGDASYQLPVCLGGLTSPVTPTNPSGCNGFNTFVFEPYENGTVTPGVWQTWNVATGNLWSTHDYNDGANCNVTNGSGGAPFYTLAALRTACPAAVVVGYGVNIGSNNPSYTVRADAFDFNGTTYNFEPYLIKHKDDCKNNGWKQSTNPTFTSQKQCIDWAGAKASGDLRLANPSQRIDFKVANHVGKHPHKNGRNTVEYWNYDYPGGLHYSADVTCTNVNPVTNEARFMFQIPAGHPGLSGLYIVAYVKETSGKNTPDLYGHASTMDAATATQWCQTGTGFAPTMYTVTKGKVELDS
jgi:hypothetical protein